MELRYKRVAAIAQFADLLMGQQVPVGTAVGRMAGSTSFDAGRRMLENERSVLGRVAFATPFIPGAAEP